MNSFSAFGRLQRKKNGRRIALCLTVLMLFGLTGCGMQTLNPMDKIRDVEYTVMTRENMPEEVLREVEERKEKEFRMTFRDGENLYICLGYGAKERGGYSITVTQMYEAKNGLYVETELQVPEEEKPGERDVVTYPYIIIKTEYREKPVIFL